MNAPETSRGRFLIQTLGYESPSDPFVLIDEQEESLRAYFSRLAAFGFEPSLIISDVSAVCLVPCVVLPQDTIPLTDDGIIYRCCRGVIDARKPSFDLVSDECRISCCVSPSLRVPVGKLTIATSRYHSEHGHYKRLGERADLKIETDQTRYNGSSREEVMLEVS